MSITSHVAPAASSEPDSIAGRFSAVGSPTGGLPLQPFVAVVRPPRAKRLRRRNVFELAPTTWSPHPELPPLPGWGYGQPGHPRIPGPLLEARAGKKTRVVWRNRLHSGELPFATAVVAVDDDGDSTQNHLGDGGGQPQDLSSAPVGWAVTHLHGAHVGPESDGWPDHMMPDGGAQECLYPNDEDNGGLGLAKVGAFLWYHDHAMDATRYHVYAGLAGGYLVRHPRERELGLPTSVAEGETVLLLQDRNLTVDGDGAVRALHKVTADTAEFFGPLTMVNGMLWPRMDVRGDIARLRICNGSNSRTYRLHLLDGSGQPVHGRVLVIGTEGGLLWKAAPVGVDAGLILAPAERLDVIVDLRGLAGQHIYVVNSAAAPFSGDGAPADLLAPRPEDRIPFPQVMRLDVDQSEDTRDTEDTESTQDPGHLGQTSRSEHLWDRLAAGTVLNPAFRRLTHRPSGSPDGPHELVIPGDHEHRLVILSESDPPGHLQLTEVVPDPNGHVEVQLPTDTEPQPYAAVGSSLYDTVGILPKLGQWEVWRFLNTTGDTHPMHIHQSTFQPLGDAGTCYTVTDADDVCLFDQPSHTTTSPLVPAPAGTGIPRSFDDWEVTGWKDTLRIDPGQLVSVAVRFDLVGRYVYHCHIIEHEDHEMMRPFVVTPLAMDGHMGGMHM